MDTKQENNQPTIVIYSTPTCPHCIHAKDFLKEHNFTYEEHDASTPQVREELVEKTGQLGVPVIYINDEMILGYDETKLRELLSIT